jgi:hypothetical protein
MALSPRRSAWMDRVEATLVCPTCGAANHGLRKPIRLDADGTALCFQCMTKDDSKRFQLPREVK